MRTSEQTGGAIAEMDLELRPTAFLSAEHIHRSQEEKFQVLDGHILLRCRGEESINGSGETVAAPLGAARLGTARWRRRASRSHLHPGAGIEQFFDELFRLAREGRVNGKTCPRCRTPPVSASPTTCTSPARRCHSSGPAFRLLTNTNRLLPRSGS